MNAGGQEETEPSTVYSQSWLWSARVIAQRGVLTERARLNGNESTHSFEGKILFGIEVEGRVL